MNLGLNGETALSPAVPKASGLACAQALLEARRARRHLLAYPSEYRCSTGPRCPARLGFAADLTDAPHAAADMVALVEKALGPIDILVNSAGAAKRTPPDHLTLPLGMPPWTRNISRPSMSSTR